MTIQELLEKKGRLAEEAKQILDDPANAGRIDLRSEDQTKFDAIHVDIEKITALVQRMQKQEEIEKNLNTAERRTEPNPIENRQTEQRRIAGRATSADADMALRGWLLCGHDEADVTESHRLAAQRCGVDLNKKQFRLRLSPTALRSLDARDVDAWMKSEEKRAAMGVGSGAIGGYTVPDAPMGPIEKALLAFGGMRMVATVIRTDTGADLPIPTNNDTGNKGRLLAENTQVTETDLTAGQVVYGAFKFSSDIVLASVEFLQDTSIPVVDFIGTQLGTRIGRSQNDYFTTGTGVAQPKGIVAAATDSAVTTVSQTLISYDEMVNLEHSVDPAYRTGAKWMFHDGALKALKKVKALQYSGDTTGLPIWLPGLAGTAPDTILGYPYVINQSMSTPATTVKSVLFGDLSKYIIRDCRDITLVRLDERYADYHQVGFLAFARSDGDLIDAGTHPVKYLTQG